MSKRPTVTGYEIYAKGTTHVALNASSSFKKMSKNQRIIFLNKMGRLLMQLVINTQNEKDTI